MARVGDIRDYFEKAVPSYMKLSFDNVGLLVGTPEIEVKKAVVSLDITDSVIEEAEQFGAQLILSHHPLFFELKSVCDDDRIGRKVIALIKNGISAICLHTNLDTVEGGVNDALMRALGARVTGLLNPHGRDGEGREYGISRVGELDAEQSFADFLKNVKLALKAGGLRYHDAGRAVKKIACCGGSGGGDILYAVKAGCDTFVTGDVKYDQFLAAKDWNINLIDADHFCTENVVLPSLAGLLERQFPEIEVKTAVSHGQTAQFFI